METLEEHIARFMRESDKAESAAPDNRAPLLLKPSSFAALAELSRSTVYALIANGKIRATKIGGSLRIPRSELDRLTREKTNED